MRLLALAALAIIVSRSVLDPEAGVTLLQGLMLMGLGVIVVNWLLPKRGISLTSLVAFHLITRRRKERRHASNPTSIGAGRGHRRHSRNEDRRHAD